MHQHPTTYDHLRELEQRRRSRQLHATRRTHDNRYPPNTLGPNEDTLLSREAQRKKRNRVSVPKPQTQRHSTFRGQFIILMILVSSVWAMAKLIIHLLSTP